MRFKYCLLVALQLFSVSIELYAQDKAVTPIKKSYTYAEMQSEVQKQVEEKVRKLSRTQIEGFAGELISKEKALNVRELELRKREEQIALTTKELESKYKSFQEIQTKFIGCVDDSEKQIEKRVKHSVEIVSNMKPQQAADLLSVQDADISVRILSLLSPEKVSKIFNLMNKEISARLQKQYMNMKR